MKGESNSPLPFEITTLKKPNLIRINNDQKQLSKGVLKKRCSENMQHIYRR